jgi:hypothetical protein
LLADEPASGSIVFWNSTVTYFSVLASELRKVKRRAWAKKLDDFLSTFRRAQPQVRFRAVGGKTI